MSKDFTRPRPARIKRKLLSALLFLAVLSLFSGEAFPAQTTLQWYPPTTNTDGSPLTNLAGYQIYYGTASYSYSYAIDVGNVTSYTVTNLTPGTTYYFAATAYNTLGVESTYSNEAVRAIAALPVLTVSKNGPGTVTGSGINCGSTCTASYNTGTVVTLSATPIGSTFSGWSGGGCSGTGTCLTTMNANTTITASFVALPPVASFTGSPLSGQVPLYVSFTDASSNNPDEWTWNFGDGTAGYEQDPGHVYKTPGTYSVTLTAANDGGSNTMTRTSYITVSSCPNQRFRIARVPTVTYATLQAAYNASSANDIIQSQAFDFSENLNFNRNVAVTLSGGYNCGYTTNVPETTILGSLTVSSGTLIADGLILQ